MIIHANTTIAAILKEEDGALEAIVAIHPRFSKLRNPVIRKLMAGRTTIAMAAKISGCRIEDFFHALSPLGFEADQLVAPINEIKTVPGFMQTLRLADLVELDVRPVIASGQDPLQIIMQKIKEVKAGQTLKIINSFEPVPLIALLEKKGFATHSISVNEQLVETYFHRRQPTATPDQSPVEATTGWDELLARFKGHLQTLDVRSLEMPGPMMAIIEAVDALPDEKALFVYHKRIPVFLLPELAEKKLEYRIREISEGNVQLLIFKN